MSLVLSTTVFNDSLETHRSLLLHSHSYFLDNKYLAIEYLGAVGRRKPPQEVHPTSPGTCEYGKTEVKVADGVKSAY